MTNTYQRIAITLPSTKETVVLRSNDNAFIPFTVGNTDYMAFKLALQTGKNADGTAVALEDATGTAMTSAQITTFLETLP
jgi:hypothetical protein